MSQYVYVPKKEVMYGEVYLYSVLCMGMDVGT